MIMTEGRGTTTTTQPTPVDPPQLLHSPAFAQGMIVPAGPTLYVGGQNGTDSNGSPEHVAKLTIYLDAGIDPGAAYAVTR
jgi:2-iminobutanoate/2-iminopropanoate deaminase